VGFERSTGLILFVRDGLSLYMGLLLSLREGGIGEDAGDAGVGMD
jgi:hypothetical protein